MFIWLNIMTLTSQWCWRYEFLSFSSFWIGRTGKTLVFAENSLRWNSVLTATNTTHDRTCSPEWTLRHWRCVDGDPMNFLYLWSFSIVMTAKDKPIRWDSLRWSSVLSASKWTHYKTADGVRHLNEHYDIDVIVMLRLWSFGPFEATELEGLEKTLVLAVNLLKWSFVLRRLIRTHGRTGSPESTLWHWRCVDGDLMNFLSLWSLQGRSTRVARRRCQME